MDLQTDIRKNIRMDVRTFEQMYLWTDGRTEKREDGCTDSQMDVFKDRQRNIKIYGCTFEQMDLRTDRHTEKHMKGCKDSQKDGPMDGWTD